MQFRRYVGFWVLAGMLLFVGTLLGMAVWRYPGWLNIQPNSERQTFWLLVIAAITLIVVMFLLAYHLLGRELGRSAYRKQDAEDLQPQVARSETSGAQLPQHVVPKAAYLRERYGLFWRSRLRLLLVVGEPEQIEAVAPGLAEQRWLEGQNTVLLWAGSVESAPSDSLLLQWRGLCRRRALNGVVWAVSKDQCSNVPAMGAGARRLQELARALHWQLPLHLWQVGDSAWSQGARHTQSVGCLLPSRLTSRVLDNSLDNLIEPLRHAGLAQMHDDLTHDFLLRLSRDLQAYGIAHWRQALTPLLGGFSNTVLLRGLWFSPPAPRIVTNLEHFWPVDTTWQGVLNDNAGTNARLGWGAYRVCCAFALGLAVLWGGGIDVVFRQQPRADRPGTRLAFQLAAAHTR